MHTHIHARPIYASVYTLPHSYLLVHYTHSSQALVAETQGTQAPAGFPWEGNTSSPSGGAFFRPKELGLRGPSRALCWPEGLHPLNHWDEAALPRGRPGRTLSPQPRTEVLGLGTGFLSSWWRTGGHTRTSPSSTSEAEPGPDLGSPATQRNHEDGWWDAGPLAPATHGGPLTSSIGIT